MALTEQDLTIYRLRLRVALLERVCYSVSISLMMKAGAPLEVARRELEGAIDRANNEMRGALPAYSDPAQNALAHEEFREIIDGLKDLARSYG